MSFTFFIGACSSSSSKNSSTYMMPESDLLSEAPGEAYGGEGMIFRKGMPDRRNWKPWQFYYKHCSINGNETYYSKTSYDCTGPYY